LLSPPPSLHTEISSRLSYRDREGEFSNLPKTFTQSFNRSKLPFFYCFKWKILVTSVRLVTNCHFHSILASV
jgi:hypothetical protein